MKDLNDEIIQVAYYYYKLNLKQQDIADKMNISRQKVNRLIQRALAENIVEIKINGYENFDIDLEYTLESKYGLEKAIVVKDNIDINPIGVASSVYLNKLIGYVLEEKNNCSVGISWGNALSNMTKNYQKDGVNGQSVNVVQLCGGINTNEVEIKPEEVTNELAIILGGKAYNLFAPALLENKELVKLLKKEKYYSKILKKYKSLDISVVGIGNLDSEGTLMKYSYIESDIYEKLYECKAIGDVCLRMFNESGEMIVTYLDDLIMGISTEDYQNIPYRIGIAYGENKAKQIRAAIKGKIINILITDDITVKKILELDLEELI